MTSRDQTNEGGQRPEYAGQVPPSATEAFVTFTDLTQGTGEAPSQNPAAAQSRSAQAGAIGQTAGSARRKSKSAASDESTTSTVQNTVNQAQQTASQGVNTAEQTAGQVANQAAAKANQGMDTAASGLADAAGAIRQQAEGMSDQGASGTLQDVALATADKLESAAHFLRETSPEELVSDLEDLVRRKPVESVLVAAGIGFLLSKVMR